MSAPPLASPATGPGAPPWRFAWFLRATVARFLLAVFRVRVLGRENLVEDGGYILAGNHVSYLDPALLWCIAPRPTHFMAKSELFAIPIVGWGLARVWAFPINRRSADREAIVRATDLLRMGEPVGMFPEGTRRRTEDGAVAPELGEAHAGVAFIAMRAGVPVVPVGIAGTERALPAGARFPRFVRVTMNYGPPVDPAQFASGSRKDNLAAMTAEIMRRIAIARDEAEKG